MSGPVILGVYSVVAQMTMVFEWLIYNEEH